MSPNRIMRAYQLRKTGQPHVLKMEKLPEPSPNPWEVKIKMKAIGINYAEILSRKGQYSWAPKKPYIMGMEGVGEIVEIGKTVTKFKIGDQIVFGKQAGAYAEYTCVAEHLCFPMLPHFSIEENAAYTVNFITAWVALKKMGRVVKGERVLIHAAAGGVGTAAVQIANALGCRVYGTASKKEKMELIEKLGATPINYNEEDFYDRIIKDGGKVDCILEVVGGEVFKKSIKLLAPFGRIAVIGFASMNLKRWNPLSWIKTYWDAPKVNLMKMAVRSQGIYASHIGYLTENKALVAPIWQELKTFVEKHHLKPVIGKVIDFESLPDAHALMESRNSTGKLIVKI